MTTGTAAVTPFRLACPLCRIELKVDKSSACCPACRVTYPRTGGIWRLVPPAEEPRFDTFAREYATVRESEGWRHDAGDYFRRLPAVPADDPFAALWQRRARSFDLLVRRVLRPLEVATGRPLAILDLGAGNCWLSHRLAARGHALAAVDLLTNDWDGLGAARRYAAASITTLQATFDRLPLADATADVAIFNAAFHYSADYGATLAEALRLLRPGGLVVILDSPLYRDQRSGAEMVRERAATYRQRHGFASDTLGGVGYLTRDVLHTLGADLNIRWRTLDVSSAMRHSLRRALSRLRRQREAATMPLIIGQSSLPPDSRTWVNAVRAAEPLVRPETPGFRARRAIARRIVRWRYLAFQRHRHNSLVLERVHGTAILVLPTVFNPHLFRTGAFLAGALDASVIPPGSSVLDMGTGSGVGAIFAARHARRVVAVDINPAAARCARINALMHHLEDRIEVREGDLFAPVGNERFDIVLFNPPYFRGAPADALDHAWRSNDVVERFAADLGDHLSPRGRALVVLSTDGDTRAFLRAFGIHGFTTTIAARRDFGNEVVTVYELSVGSGP